MILRTEKDVKEQVKKLFKKHGIWYFMPQGNGYGRQGIPDFIACAGGLFLAIETKYGGNKLSPHQDREIRHINVAKGCAFVVNEHNIASLDSTLRVIMDNARRMVTHEKLASRTG